MSPRGRRAIWSAIFLALFVLSLDYWRWDERVRFGPLGLPSWSLYFVALLVLLSGAIAVFARTDWEGDGEEPPASEPAP